MHMGVYRLWPYTMGAGIPQVCECGFCVWVWFVCRRRPHSIVYASDELRVNEKLQVSDGCVALYVCVCMHVFFLFRLSIHCD